MDAISEARLAEVNPALSQRAHALANALAGEGFIPRITSGIRTVAQQDALYAQGRTEPGVIVTNAKGTESNHVMGWACDWAFMDANGEVDWQSPGFDRLIALAPSYGLRSGASWGDKPHTELVEFPTEPTPEQQQVYLAAGVAQVWAEFPIAS